MPEGPSLVLLKEDILQFRRKKVMAAGGNAAIDVQQLEGRQLLEIRTWGKQLFLLFSGKITIRIHLLMFGSYSINEQIRLKRSIKLELQFNTGTLYFYTCSVKEMEPGWETTYDWNADLLSKKWAPRAARAKLKKIPETLVCDALLDQQIFSGSGNIVKNEVLFRIFLHPESTLGAIPPQTFTLLIREAKQYCYDFLQWKREGTLKKHWQIIGKKKCPRCDLAVQKKYCGKTRRRTFFCKNCQEKYV
ncbi:MAG: DNA-formamidopyrimidine glycosylase family protein [Chitinophagaceae bacterium]